MTKGIEIDPLSAWHYLEQGSPNCILRSTCAAHHPISKISCSSFDVDFKEVPLQLQMELIDLQNSEDLKFKYLAFHILDLY